MRVPRRTAWAILIASISMILGMPLLMAGAENEPGGASPEAIAEQRRERVRTLEAWLKAARDEIERQHDLPNAGDFEAEIARMKALGSYADAKLKREVAEIALVEYRDGIFRAELEAAKETVKRAEDELTRAKDRAANSNRAVDRLAVERADDVLDQAKAKVDAVDKVDHVRRLGELRRDIETARMEELAIDGQIKLEQAAVARKHQHKQKYGAVAPEEQIASLWTSAADKIARAKGLFAEAQRLSDQAGNDPKAAKEVAATADAKRAEAGKLTKEAQTSLGDALGIAKQVVTAWTRIRDSEEELKFARIALRRSQPSLVPSDKDAAAAKPGGEPIEVLLEGRRNRVRELEEKIRLQRETLTSQHGDIRLKAQASVLAAKAAHDKSKLPRQVAEIMAREYSEVTQPREVELAHAVIKRAEAALDGAKQQANGTNVELDRLELQRAEFVLDHAKLKLEVLTKYDQKRKKAELQSEIERCKSVELATRATFGFERSKEAHAQELVARFRTSAQEDLVVALLDVAIEQAKQLEAGVATAKKLADQATNDPIRAKMLAATIEAKRSAPKNLIAYAQPVLSEAVKLARQVSADWTTLLEAEEELTKARASVASLEKLAEKK